MKNTFTFKDIFETVSKINIIDEQEEMMKGESFDIEKIYPGLINPYFIDRYTMSKSTVTLQADMLYIMVPYITKFEFSPVDAIPVLKRNKMRLKGIEVVKNGMIIIINIKS